ncbi:MAG: hypothetical protein ABW019_03695 [Chitinophagaceae bacterium]
MANEVKLRLEIPAAFQQACEALHTDPQQALQILVNHLVFYAQLVSPGDDPESQAGILLREYLDTRGPMPAPNYKTRELNVKYTQEVLALLRADMNGHRRKKLYLRLVDQWHRELQDKKPLNK